ncbi:hypothetical protein IPM62_02780 [Candidatus Woesebacteria bacterium]|nr:MAG: hypothetical protein IPM62_02780 [Candidatus Woesebacteria bacterium]
MRKEVLLAIIAGVSFGLIIALGVWRANNAFSTKPEEVEIVEEEKLALDEDNTVGISVSDPENYDVITISPVNIVGVTTPNSWVGIQTEDDDYTVLANASGEFNHDIELTGGINNISLTAFTNDGQSTHTTLTLVYSTEFNKQDD